MLCPPHPPHHSAHYQRQQQAYSMCTMCIHSKLSTTHMCASGGACGGRGGVGSCVTVDDDVVRKGCVLSGLIGRCDGKTPAPSLVYHSCCVLMAARCLLQQHRITRLFCTGALMEEKASFCNERLRMTVRRRAAGRSTTCHCAAAYSRAMRSGQVDNIASHRLRSPSTSADMIGIQSAQRVPRK